MDEQFFAESLGVYYEPLGAIRPEADHFANKSVA
jgi:hypothetical protein